jgi:hypothetical protein
MFSLFPIKKRHQTNVNLVETNTKTKQINLKRALYITYLEIACFCKNNYSGKHVVYDYTRCKDVQISWFNSNNGSLHRTDGPAHIKYDNNNKLIYARTYLQGIGKEFHY